MILVRTAGVFLTKTVSVSEASDSWLINQRSVPCISSDFQRYGSRDFFVAQMGSLN